MADIIRTPPVRVVNGEQVWLLARTDRDGASAGVAEATAGPAMSSLLKPLDPGDPWEIFKSGAHEFRIGAARPLIIESVRQMPLGSFDTPELPAGEVLADRGRDAPGVMLARSQRPWWVVVRFWWRKPEGILPAWPCIGVDWLGFRTRAPTEADWILWRSVVPAVASAEPGAETWGEKQTKRATDLLNLGASVGIVGGLGIAIVVAALYARRLHK